MSSRASVEVGTDVSSGRCQLTRPTLESNLESTLESTLGYSFVDPKLLVTALSHRSWCVEHGGRSNERLEFLGDAVLGLLVAEWAYRRHSDRPEGHLAKIRADVVSAHAVAETARSVSLGDALLLGSGEADGGGRDKDSILSDAMEAVLGAVYLDGGHSAASRLVGNLFIEAIDRAAVAPGIGDYKTRLQELVARQFTDPPRYHLVTDGPDHNKRFHVMVEAANEVFGPALGTSRKRGEQAAARLACEVLEGQEDGGGW